MLRMKRENFFKGRKTVHKKAFWIAAASLVLAAVNVAAAAGNERIESFNKAKKLLEQKVYFDHRFTFYCQAPFDARKKITLPEGFSAPKHAKRSLRVEWEHVVPAENFGRAFVEWREGSSECVDGKGRSFKGRKCAEKANASYRLMQSDLYNLYPAIGSVNAMRSNYRYAMLPGVPNTFGTCAMKIDGRRAEPPEYTRGAIARMSLYMEDAYSVYKMSGAQRKLMQAWDKMHPVDQWECLRAKRIEAVQGNENKFVSEPCRRKGWY